MKPITLAAATSNPIALPISLGFGKRSLVSANTCEVLVAIQPIATAIMPSSTGTLSTNGTEAINAAAVSDDPAMKNRRRPVSTPPPFRNGR